MIRCCCYCYGWCYLAFNVNLKSCFSQHVPDGSFISRLWQQQQLNRNRTVSLVTFNLTKWWTKLTKAYATENKDEKKLRPNSSNIQTNTHTCSKPIRMKIHWQIPNIQCCFLFMLLSFCLYYIFRFSLSETSNTCSFDPNNEVIKSKRNCSSLDSKVKPICYSKYRSPNMEKWSKKINHLFNLC